MQIPQWVNNVVALATMAAGFIGIKTMNNQNEATSTADTNEPSPNPTSPSIPTENLEDILDRIEEEIVHPEKADQRKLREHLEAYCKEHSDTLDLLGAVDEAKHFAKEHHLLPFEKPDERGAIIEALAEEIFDAHQPALEAGTTWQAKEGANKDTPTPGKTR